MFSNIFLIYLLALLIKYSLFSMFPFYGGQAEGEQGLSPLS